MVSTRIHISNSFSRFTNPLVTEPSTPITIGIIVTFMFHSFSRSLARSRYLSLFAFLQFYSVVNGGGKVLCSKITRSSHLAEIRWFVDISKSQRIFVRRFLQSGFRVVYIPFDPKMKFRFDLRIKFRFLAKFPLDYPPPSRVNSKTIFLLIYCIRFL